MGSTSRVTRRMSHVTRHTSHVISLRILNESERLRGKTFWDRQTGASHVTCHTSHVKCHALHVTCHTSCVTLHSTSCADAIQEKEAKRRAAGERFGVWGLGFGVWGLGFGVRHCLHSRCSKFKTFCCFDSEVWLREFWAVTCAAAADANDFSFAPVVNENSMILASAIDR